MSNVLVLYVDDPQKVVKHFTAMGFEFKEEKHGVYGKIHWACEKDGKVLEIYPSDTTHNRQLAGIRFL